MKFKSFKKYVSVLLCVIITICTAAIANASETDIQTNPDSYPYFAQLASGIYAHDNAGSDSKEAWQKWESMGGINANVNCKYIFLPAYTSSSEVELFNGYDEAVTIGDTVIKSGEAGIISYTEGKEISVKKGEKVYSLLIYKSDSEASVYVNDTTGTYTDRNGKTIESDFYSFLTLDKENSVSGSGCAIVNADGTTNTTLKKIKGRGNTNWKTSDKKPFNLTFNSSTTIGHITSKKFSLISNSKDSTMLRNKIMYDLSNEVGSPYAPDTSYIDFYVNGVYRGCYLISQKVALGKNSLVTLKDKSDTQDTDFSFLVEVDVWNYQNDVYFTSDKGYAVVCKSPDLDGYNEGDKAMIPKYNFIRSKYQELENALYKGTLSDLEAICDMDSLATMYLIQEFGKNCDGGYTSTYFTYDAEKGKFFACPVWDFDSTLGAVDCVRDGCSTSTCNYKGWTTRLATYKRTVNSLGRAFNMTGKTSEGKTFEDICKEIWRERFLPAIDIILSGGTSKNGRLKSADEYKSSIAKASFNNYVMWDFAWVCSLNKSGLTTKYSQNYDGEVQYMKDWTVARRDWMNNQFSDTPATEPATTAPPQPTGVSYYLQGDGFGGWFRTDPAYQLKDNGDGTYYIDITLKAGTSYKFKIINSNGTYYDPDFSDEVTCMYVTSTGNHNNAGCKPEKDTNVTITLRNGSFYVAYYELGDVNEDYKLDIKDVTRIQEYITAKISLSNRQTANADTNGDGKINIRDATVVQRIIAGLTDED